MNCQAKLLTGHLSCFSTRSWSLLLERGSIWMNEDIAMENQHDFCKGRFCLTKLWWFCEGVSKQLLWSSCILLHQALWDAMGWGEGLAQISSKKQERTLSRCYIANVSWGWWSRINLDISVRAPFCFHRSRAAQLLSCCCPPPQQLRPFPCSSHRASPWFQWSPGSLPLPWNEISALAPSSLAYPVAVWGVVASNPWAAALSHSRGSLNLQDPYLNNLTAQAVLEERSSDNRSAFEAG